MKCRKMCIDQIKAITATARPVLESVHSFGLAVCAEGVIAEKEVDTEEEVEGIGSGILYHSRRQMVIQEQTLIISYDQWIYLVIT